MPPLRRLPKEKEPSYKWTTGNMKGINHNQLIAVGGFGEVHKVTSQIRLADVLIQMVDTENGAVHIF
jgi:hypothetical protein